MPHDQHAHDPMQTVFDGAEAATDALCAQEGCERALRLVFDQIRFDPDTEQMAQALVDSLSHWRQAALSEVKRMQQASLGTV
jgi:hypothetical protein